MREIRFRGQRKDNGEWVYGYYVQRSHKDCCVYHYIYTGFYFEDENQEGTELEIYEVIPETVGQYTGLKDKNGKGKKVWENDIFIKNKNDDEGYDYVEYRPKEGKFELHKYHNPVTDISLLDAIFTFGDTCEIIGNIHDNPKLLE